MANKREERAAQAAALLAADRAKARRRRYLNIGGVVVAMIVIIGGAVLWGQHSGNNGKIDAGAAIAGPSDYELAIGDPNAPHKVIMYEDFACPVCQQFEASANAGLATAAADGKVYLEYRPFNLNWPDSAQLKYSQEALNAFVVLMKTSGDDVAKKFHDLLYENQPAEGGNYPDITFIENLAVQAGADESAVKDSIDNMSDKDWLDGATNFANSAGVQGTPTILLDGQNFTQGSNYAEIGENLVKAIG